MFDPKKLEEIRAVLEKAGPAEDTDAPETGSGIPIRRLYTPLDVSGLDYSADLGLPGRPPFTRGVYPEMYRRSLWTRRQVAGYGTAEETNQRLRLLNEAGQTGLNIVPDTPTIYGLDSDDPLAEGEVGREGVAVDSLMDVRDMFEGLDLSKVSTSIIYNYPTWFCMYLALARERGLPYEALAGTLQNDTFAISAGSKSWQTTPRASLKLATDVVEFCTRRMPRWNPVSLAGYHFREGGCTAVQEVAFTLGGGIEYLNSALGRGLTADQVAPRISFFFDAHNDFFEEICKFRAARRMWDRIMRDRFRAETPEARRMRFHTQTAGCSLTAQQPLNNVVRATIQALASVLGGTQSLHTNSYDEAYALPSEGAAKLALRTQQIIAYESGVTRTVDPLAGSYFVEALTDEIEARAMELIGKIDRLGGMLAAVEQNFVQREITDSALKAQNRIDRGEDRIIGVNLFEEPGEEIRIELMKIPLELERKQVARLHKVRAERDESRTREALERLEAVMRAGDNTIEAMIEAVSAMATTGEIGALFRKVYGEYKDPGL